MKQTLVTLAVFTLAVGVMAAGSAAAQPTQISDWNDLNNVSDDLAGDYELANDLDGNSDGYETLVNTTDGWQPIGNSSDPFTGSFDGDGHTISDLFIDRDDEDFVGLFGGVGSGGTIGNVSPVEANDTVLTCV